MIIVNQNSVWLKAQTLKLQVSENISPGFDVGFDKRISKNVEQELRSFINRVEEILQAYLNLGFNPPLLRAANNIAYLLYKAIYSLREIREGLCFMCKIISVITNNE